MAILGLCIRDDKENVALASGTFYNRPVSDAGKKTSNPWHWIPTLYLAEGFPNAIVASVSIVLYK
ncbi:MAG TPA: hypothetical protein VN625_02835, partial [Desulfuromonadaceae bacterium]|nr:hypothetical protein [Desulfuromonadaceae bacterium]